MQQHQFPGLLALRSSSSTINRVASEASPCITALALRSCIVLSRFMITMFFTMRGSIFTGATRMLAPMIRIKSAVRTSLMASLKSGAIPSPKRTTSGFRGRPQSLQRRGELPPKDLPDHFFDGDLTRTSFESRLLLSDFHELHKPGRSLLFGVTHRCSG